jgi:transmembrane sensor
MNSERQLSPAGRAEADTDSAAERTPLDWPRQTGRLGLVMDAIALRKKRQRVRRMQATVAVTAGLVVAGFSWRSITAGARGLLDSKSPTHAVLLLPEQRTLPDGSVVELKDGSEISVDFAGALRRVALRKGNVHFQVAKNPERAFVVEAGGMEFRAVGTAFAVQFSGANVEMLVTEGRVAVERAPLAGAETQRRGDAKTRRRGDVPSAPRVTDDLASARLVLVEAGNQVVMNLAATADVDPLPQITPLSPAESGQKLAWRVPRLELSDTPLAEAIVAINRHSPVPLEIKDAALAKLGISGVLRADNVEPLLQMLESNYAIRADRSEPGKILLRQGR